MLNRFRLWFAGLPDPLKFGLCGLIPPFVFALSPLLLLAIILTLVAAGIQDWIEGNK